MNTGQRLSGKNALITGAGTGIGRGIAVKLAAAGAHVVLAGRRLAQLKETADHIVTFKGVPTVLQMDVTNRESIAAAIASLKAQFSSLDILVNNAGATGINHVDDASGDDCWDSVLRTNLDGMYWCCKAAVPIIPDAGRIINIGSVLSQRAAANSSAYVASKHGVIGLTRALAIDLAPRRITVNAVCPGWVKTDMADEIIGHISEQTSNAPDVVERNISKNIPLGRMVHAEEIGAMVAFLASSDADMITGQAITICGGSSLV